MHAFPVHLAHNLQQLTSTTHPSIAINHTHPARPCKQDALELIQDVASFLAIMLWMMHVKCIVIT
jgi:hypothetical protein